MQVPGTEPNGYVKFPNWWQWTRRVVIFGLGVAIIIEGLVSAQDRIAELVVGLIMVGILPLDEVLRSMPHRRAVTETATGDA